MNIRRQFRLLFVAATLLFAASAANATLVGTVLTSPGDTVPPGLASGPPGTLLATLVNSASFTTTAGTTNFIFTTAVYREAGGTLDFYYQLSNSITSATSLARLTATSFAGYTTSLGYRTDGASWSSGLFGNGTVAPITGDRSTAGSVVGFNFNPPVANMIDPGETSFVLVISTNATQFTPGNYSVIDGGSFTGPAFQPSGTPASGTSPVTDSGATGVLLGLALAALCLGQRFLRSANSTMRI